MCKHETIQLEGFLKKQAISGMCYFHKPKWERAHEKPEFIKETSFMEIFLLKISLLLIFNTCCGKKMLILRKLYWHQCLDCGHIEEEFLGHYSYCPCCGYTKKIENSRNLPVPKH